MNPDTTTAMPTAARLTPALTFLLTCICGVAVASVYMAQPLLDALTHDLGVASGSAGLVVGLTQCGYFMGLLFIVPLGDVLPRRGLILAQMSLSALALTLTAASGSFILLLGALFIVGLSAVVIQITVALAAQLALPEQRGKAIGALTSGVVLGILSGRCCAGFVADIAGWRSVYLITAMLMLVMVLILRRGLPTMPAQARPIRLLRADPPWRLWATLPLLRVRSVLALLCFASFSILWTALVLPLTAPPYALSHGQVGLFGLAGVAGALAASRAGRLADRGKGRALTGWALLLLALSWLCMLRLEHNLLWLIAGVVMLDFAVQAVHVTSQSLIVGLRPEAQSRIIGAYMLFYSLGSAVGGVAATQTYAFAGWPGVCLLGSAVSSIAVLYWWLTRHIG